MVLRLPKEIPIEPAFGIGILLAAAQIIEGTSIITVVLSALFFLASVAAFNLCGGFRYPSGAYVGFCSLLTVLLAMFAKAAMGQPFERNLLAPQKTLLVYVVGMSSMLAAAYVNRKLRPKRGLLERLEVGENSLSIGVGCLVIAIFVPLILPPTLVSTFVQGNYFYVLAILIPVYNTVQQSDGRRTFTLVAFSSWVLGTLGGLLTFSKASMFGSSFAWGLSAVSAGYRTSIRKLVFLIVIGVAVTGVLTPLSQVGRVEGRSLPAGEALALIVNLVSHPLELRAQYEEQSEGFLESGVFYHMFDGPEGLLDRLNMFAVDDALIQKTDEGSTSSLAALWTYFENIVPRYFYQDKPILHWGNTYAHEIGMLGDEDYSTGISFSPFADAYHCGQWLGVTAVAFAIFLFGFYLMDAVAGSTDASIWPLIFLIYAAHGAPEGMMGGPVYGGATLTVFVWGAAFVCSRVVPIIGNIISPPKATSRAFASRVQSA
jgi:hypothetical protein